MEREDTEAKGLRWYVEIPRYAGAKLHPRHWRIVCVEAGSEQDEAYRTELVRDSRGELVPTMSSYWPFPDEQSCIRFIKRNLRKWDGDENGESE